VSELVTIGITCFNAKATIARAIKSALNQDWQNFEILIVDDCSLDCSVEIIQDVIKNDSRARLIKHSVNLGPAGARNTILDQAMGEYIVYFDDDDESLVSRISEQIQCLLSFEKRTGKELIACYASGRRLYPNGYEKSLYAIGSRQDNQVPHGSAVADYLLYFKQNKSWFYGAGTPTCALLARISTIKAIGGFDSNLRRVEDIDFAIRLALNDGYFIGTSKVLFKQYVTEAFDKNPKNNLNAEQAVVRKYFEYLSEKNKYYYAYNWPLIRYFYFNNKYYHSAVTFIKIFIKYPLYSMQHILKTGSRRLLHDLRISK